MPDHSPAPDAARVNVVARPAASLVVLRDGAQPEVLMGMRGNHHKFMPNKLVFPGGRVDAEDHDAPVATPLPAHVLARLARGADDSLAHAIGTAAARELEEETGLSLGTPPSLGALDYLCRAITPSGLPMRFDAHFLVVRESEISGTLAGSGELDDLRWYAIDAALALQIATPTRGVLEYLKAWMALDEPARRAVQTVPTMRENIWVIE
jgi:8-oxo-dGTP pyrophosphatase MutT (NUDIX family)